MSNSKGVRFGGSDEEWNGYAAELKKKGKTIQEDITNHVKELAEKNNQEVEETTKTASRHCDNLIESLSKHDLSKVIMTGSYHVIIDDGDFIKTCNHDLGRYVKRAVCTAVWRYWINIWSVKKADREYSEDMVIDKETYIKQLIVKINLNSDTKQQKLLDSIDKIKVTFECVLPMITLSDLREKDLGKIIMFDSVIVGPTPKKLEIEPNKYIQSVLIQEVENLSKNNNPVMIKAIIHGDDTNNIASGQTKRFIGTYTVTEPENGKKADTEKTLIIDVIAVFDLEEKAEITLTPHELATAKEFAETDKEGYLKKLIDSFCPKIYGRELEKKALYLALLGGSDFVGYRKESHLMLVGEADTGKSEMVKYADKVAQKSSIIDGSNATGVGILFALDEYDGMKILRMGAMIMNNGGHLIVDEYDKMPKPEQKKLNQSMEHQRATYNKGGHTGDAECKTTIIASCNPNNERWNEDDTIIDNLPFDASTISRYDNVIRLKHDSTENVIRAKMKHIASNKRGELDKVADPQWIKGLLNHLRVLRPILSAEAEEHLINKFVDFTMIEQEKGSLPIQTRQMEGIQRICEAYAKLLFKSEINVEIVDEVLRFYQECQATLGMKVEKGITQMDLRGHSTNKDSYFEGVFRVLSQDNEDGLVFVHDLAEELNKNDKMFKSDEAIVKYIENRKTSGWLYEPKVGVLNKQ